MWISFSDRVGVHAQVPLKVWEIGAHDQHSLTQLDEKKDTYATDVSALQLLKLMWVVILVRTMVILSIIFLQIGLMSVVHVHLSLTLSRELVREPQLDQKKISTPSFLHCRAQSGSKGPFFGSLSAWLRSFMLVHTRSFAHVQKTAFQLRIAPRLHT